MPKPKSGRKVKLSQPIALGTEYRDTLEEFKVIKGPTVPKFEQLDKYIVGRGWKLSFSDGAGDDGGASATIRTPGSATRGVYEATGETAAHAITYALCDALKAEPKQADLFDEQAKRDPVDPTGADTPLFRGNGGVASVAEMAIKNVKEQIRSGDVPGFHVDGDTIVATVEVDPDPDEIEFDDDMKDLEDRFDQAITTGDTDDAAVISAVDGWQFLFVIEPEDGTLWKETPPLVDDEGDVPNLLVAWQEGDDGTGVDRGFYLKPGYQYLRDLGQIRRRDPNGGLPREIVWERDATPVSEPKPSHQRRRSKSTDLHPLSS